jgi:hypothetical protein
MSTYVRWKVGELRESRVIGPLDPGHVVARWPCVACTQPLGNGQPVQLLAIGPDSDENRAKCRDGRWFSALAITVHAACLGTTTSEETTDER